MWSFQPLVCSDVFASHPCLALFLLLTLADFCDPILSQGYIRCLELLAFLYDSMNDKDPLFSSQEIEQTEFYTSPFWAKLPKISSNMPGIITRQSRLSLSKKLDIGEALVTGFFGQTG